MSGATISLVVGDNTHRVNVTNLNLDNSTATGVSVSYETSDAAICDVDTNGTLVPNAVGTATITETSTRGAFSHSDNGVVTVTDVNSGDFTSSLTFA